MADGKTIDIKIAATGGGQAAAEVRKVEVAADSLNKKSAESTGFGGQLEAGEKIRQAREEANAQRLKQISAEKKALADLADAEKKALDDELAGMREKEKASAEFAKSLETETGEKAGIGRKKEAALALGAIGAAAAAAAKTVGQVSDAFDSIDLTKLKAIDPEIAKQIETAKKWSTALSDPIGLLLKLTTGETISSAFAGLNEQIDNVAKQQAEAIDRLISKGIVQGAALKKLTDEIEAANAILDAKDIADGIEQDNADAAAVRAGAAQEDVDKARAQKDLDRKLEALNRPLEPKIKETQVAFDNIQTAKNNEQDVISAKTKEGGPERLAARQAVVDAEKEFKRLQTELDASKKVVEQQRRAARAETVGKVDAAEGNKASRLQEEADKKAKADARLKAQQEREERRQNLTNQEDRLNEAARGASGRFGTEGGRLPGTPLGKTLQGISNKLADGTNEAEIQKVQQEFEAATRGLGGATLAAMREMLAAQLAQAKEIQIIRQQIKNQ